MCSILGYFNTKLPFEDIVKQNLTMSHRGPDNFTVKEYEVQNKSLYFGHNRLSIQDLATHANQPMENERFVMVFNGEIYNHGVSVGVSGKLHQILKHCLSFLVSLAWNKL